MALQSPPEAAVSGPGPGGVSGAVPGVTPGNGAVAAVVSERPGFWRRPLGRVLLWAGGSLLAAAVVLAGYLYFYGVLGSNFHRLDAGAAPLYRSAQLSAEELEARVKAGGIRTVINLRGANAGKAWYDEETALLRRLQVEQIDIKMSGRKMPSRENLVALIRALKEAPRPLLVHCQSGADRTGLACSLERLLQKDGDFGAARRELDFLPYGHTGYLGYEAMDRVIDQFEQYRQQGGTRDLEGWALELYDPGVEVEP